ncbi:eukaryotic translation elongation factor 1 epsilon-1 [Prorops nasuta]|uniref:eukaryotic translation elongation factor 1 epsilon-1 n=1 Tax=Prorops nasuta TaxID=863751 RepID=UPI0034CDCF8C
MVLCYIDCINKISEYLDVTPGKLYMNENQTITAETVKNNEIIQGFSTLIQALVKNSKCPGILGNDKEMQALTRQWLEYIVLCISYSDSGANTIRILKELNIALRDRTYITGTTKTIADITLYYALHSIMNTLNNQEKAKYIHVSRWFDNMQQEEKLRKTLDMISFNLVHLYL